MVCDALKQRNIILKEKWKQVETGAKTFGGFEIYEILKLF